MNEEETKIIIEKLVDVWNKADKEEKKIIQVWINRHSRRLVELQRKSRA